MYHADHKQVWHGHFGLRHNARRTDMQLPIQVVTRSSHKIRSQHKAQSRRAATHDTGFENNKAHEQYICDHHIHDHHICDVQWRGVWRMCINQKYAVSRNEWYLFFLPPNGLLFLSNLPLFLQQQTMPSAQNVLLSKCTHSSCVAACARANKLVYTSFW